MAILVVGADGLVGKNTVSRCEETSLECVVTHHDPTTDGIALDKADSEQVFEVIAKHEPEAIIDAGAMTDVDGCETARSKAFVVNASGTGNLAEAANEVGAHLITFSTDYVFTGVPERAPHQETDPVRPEGFYAQSKYAGEQAAKIAADWTVLRTSVVYGLASPNFCTWAISELQAGNEIGIVDDQVSTPTYAPDLARAAVAVADQSRTGLYHAAGPTSLSRYEFTCRLADEFGYDRDLVEPISTAELGQKAPRPADGSLDSSSLYEALEFEFSTPREAFASMAQARAQN